MRKTLHLDQSNYGKLEKRITWSWIVILTILMVHVGSRTPILSRIANDYEYLKTTAFTFVLTFVAVFLIQKSSIKFKEKPDYYLGLVVFFIGLVASVLVYVYFKYGLGYIVEGSTLYTVDIPLIFFICLITALGFRMSQNTRKKVVIQENVQVIGYRGSIVKPIPTEEVHYVFLENECVYLVCENGDKFRSEKNLKELEDVFPGGHFFRLNRQVIASKGAILSYSIASGRKLEVMLSGFDEKTVFVSKEKSSSFKKWIASRK